MKRFESFKDFNIEKPVDHKEKMNLRRQTLQEIKDYFVEFEDRGDFVSVAKSSGYSGYNHKGFTLHTYVIEIISDFDILPSLNMKRIKSKFEIIDIEESMVDVPWHARRNTNRIRRNKVIIKIRDKG